MPDQNQTQRKPKMCVYNGDVTYEGEFNDDGEYIYNGLITSWPVTSIKQMRGENYADGFDVTYCKTEEESIQLVIEMTNLTDIDIGNIIPPSPIVLTQLVTTVAEAQKRHREPKMCVYKGIVIYEGKFNAAGEYIYNGTITAQPESEIVKMRGKNYADGFDVTYCGTKKESRLLMNKMMMNVTDTDIGNITPPTSAAAAPPAPKQAQQQQQQQQQSAVAVAPIVPSSTPATVQAQLWARIHQLEREPQQPAEAQQNLRKPYYYVSPNPNDLTVWIEGNLDRDGEHKWRSHIEDDGKSLGKFVLFFELEEWYGKNWRAQFEELKDLKGKSPNKIFRYEGFIAPNEYIEPKPMLMETWSSALKKDKRDAEDSEGSYTDVIFAQRMVADDGLKPMSDAGWLDKKSIRRTIDKTLHSDLEDGDTLDKNLARLGKYRLKKEHAVGNYIFGKWKRDRYQRKEAALATLLKANYVQVQEGETFDMIIGRENTLNKLSAATGSNVRTLDPRQVKRLKLKQ